MKTTAEAFEALAEAAAEVALALRAEASQDAPYVTQEDDLPPFPEETPTTVQAAPHGSAAVCPKHGIPYSPGRYGPYCQAKSDEPNWSNDRGFCRITPRSAAAWLRQHAA